MAKKKTTKKTASKKKATAKKKVAKKKAAAPKKKVATKKVAPKKKAAAPKTSKTKSTVKKKEEVKKSTAKTATKKTAAKKATRKSTRRKKGEKGGSNRIAGKEPLVVKSKTLIIARPAKRPVVAKVFQRPKDDRSRFNDKELKEFMVIISEKLDEAKHDYEMLKKTLANTDSNGTDDTSPSFKMMEDGSETLSREETAQLANRQEKFINNLEAAIMRIRNKTYGICRVTGKLISKERLRLVPHATLSIEAKTRMNR